MPPRSKINEPTYIYVRWLLSSFPSVKRAYASASYVRHGDICEAAAAVRSFALHLPGKAGSSRDRREAIYDTSFGCWPCW